MNEEFHSEVDEYGDPGIRSGHAPVAGWLQFSYIFWIIFGFIWWFFFWNGSYGWLDPNNWQQLQRAANTTYPTQNITNQN